MDVDVLAGATTPCQEIASKPGKPAACAMDGASGHEATGLRLVTPRIRSFPAFACPSDTDGCANVIWTCPATRSVIDGAEPLYGMCTISSLAIVRKSSSARCAPPPVPDDA